ncbi:unnamed protein product [Ectocarpus sp. 6 AP-2014]
MIAFIIIFPRPKERERCQLLLSLSSERQPPILFFSVQGLILLPAVVSDDQVPKMVPYHFLRQPRGHPATSRSVILASSYAYPIPCLLLAAARLPYPCPQVYVTPFASLPCCLLYTVCTHQTSTFLLSGLLFPKHCLQPPRWKPLQFGANVTQSPLDFALTSRQSLSTPEGLGHTSEPSLHGRYGMMIAAHHRVTLHDMTTAPTSAQLLRRLLCTPIVGR